MSTIYSIVAAGDSISYGTNKYFCVAAGDVFPAKFNDAYTVDGPRKSRVVREAATRLWLNMSVSGYRIEDLESQATELDSYINATYVAGAGRPVRRAILAVMIGTNPTSSTPATAAARIRTYCLARQAAGWEVILCTIISRGDGIIPSFDTAYAAPLNAILRTYTTSDGVGAVCDFGAMPMFFPDGANFNDTTYYDADDVHPNAVGGQEMANEFSAALSAYLGVTAGTYTRTAFVSATGDDGTAEVNNPDLPYETAAAAAADLVVVHDEKPTTIRLMSDITESFSIPDDLTAHGITIMSHGSTLRTLTGEVSISGSVTGPLAIRNVVVTTVSKASQIDWTQDSLGTIWGDSTASIGTLNIAGSNAVGGNSGAAGGTATGANGSQPAPNSPPDVGEAGESVTQNGSAGGDGGDGFPAWDVTLEGTFTISQLNGGGGYGGSGGAGGAGGYATGGNGSTGGDSNSGGDEDGATGGAGGNATANGGNGGTGGAGGDGSHVTKAAGVTITASDVTGGGGGSAGSGGAAGTANAGTGGAGGAGAGAGAQGATGANGAATANAGSAGSAGSAGANGSIS